MPRIYSINVGRGRLVRQRRAFGKILRSLPKHFGSLMGWQEIGEKDGRINERGILNNTFKQRFGWRQAGGKSHTPITYNKLRWQLYGASARTVMRGIANVSPHREVIVARLRSRWLKGICVTAINTHFVAGAHSKPGQRAEAARTAGWDQHFERLQDIVQREAIPGVNVVLTMDANNAHFPVKKLHPRAVLVHKGRIDYIIAIPAKGRRVKIGRRSKVELNIDSHDGIWADINFPKTK